jgi:hypothetical protein
MITRNFTKDEDPSRLTTASMNWAKPDFPFAGVLDIFSLNYQGEGIRQTPEFEGTDRIRTKPQYPACLTPFPSPKRMAFNGLVLAIVKAKRGEAGTVTLRQHRKGYWELKFRLQ